MNKKNPTPGVSREQGISDEGLKRLENNLRLGTRMSPQVLKQWIKRYGQAAQVLIKKYNQSVE